jgi:hypothetical protein
MGLRRVIRRPREVPVPNGINLSRNVLLQQGLA